MVERRMGNVFFVFDILCQKREAKLAVDTNHRRSGRTHNLINRKTYQDSNSLRSFKIISKKPASFAFVSPKAANRAQKATSVDPLKTKHARYVLPRGIGSLNLGTTDHGSHSWSRSTRPQTTGPLKLRRKKGSGTDNNDGEDILPSDGTTPNNVCVQHLFVFKIHHYFYQTRESYAHHLTRKFPPMLQSISLTTLLT